MASQSLVGILGINPVLDAFCLEQGNPSQEYQYFAAQEHLAVQVYLQLPFS